MIEVDSKEDLDRLLLENERLLVLFYASWCPFCKRFVPTFDCKTADFNNAKVIHVLLDDYDNQLWDDYEVDAVPTVIYFEKEKLPSGLMDLSA